MARGVATPVGTRRTSQNGYQYIRTEDGWRLLHHVIAEQKILGRELKDGERVEFIDRNRNNLHPANLLVTIKGHKTIKALRNRRAIVAKRIEEYQAELEELDRKIATREEIVHGSDTTD